MIDLIKSYNYLIIIHVLLATLAVNFFANRKKLLPEIIYLINEKILNDDEMMKITLKNNSKNLGFYENKHLILHHE